MTRAVKLKRRPPFTTLATRLIATTRSRCGVFSAGALPRPPPSRRFSRRPPPSVFPPDPPPLRCGPGMNVPFLELESGFAGGVRQRGDAPRVAVATAVEDDLGYTRGLGTLREEGADLAGDRALVTLGAPDGDVDGRRGRERVALEVVDHLGGDVPQRAGDHQAGPFRRTGDVLTDPEVPA